MDVPFNGNNRNVGNVDFIVSVITTNQGWERIDNPWPVGCEISYKPMIHLYLNFIERSNIISLRWISLTEFLEESVKNRNLDMNYLDQIMILIDSSMHMGKICIFLIGLSHILYQ